MRYNMKAPEILNIINRFLSNDKAKQYKQSKNINDVLKQLEKKAIILRKKLENENNENNLKLIEKKLAVIYAQRQKGIDAITMLKSEVSLSS